MLKIREFRFKNNVKQKELSLFLKIPANTLCNWETGVCEPPLEKLIEIANYFKISVDDLLGISPGDVG